MLNVLESVDRENKAIFNNGMKMPINQISKITHYTEAKIRRIQNSKTNK